MVKTTPRSDQNFIRNRKVPIFSDGHFISVLLLYVERFIFLT